jgi:hypothetical protein
LSIGTLPFRQHKLSVTERGSLARILLFYLPPRLLFLVEDYKYTATWTSMTLAVAPVAYRLIIGSPLKTDWRGRAVRTGKADYRRRKRNMCAENKKRQGFESSVRLSFIYSGISISLIFYL